MAKASWCGDAAYDLGGVFVERCLAHDDSLLSPGAAIWSAENISELVATVGVEDRTVTGSFIEKLVHQIDGLDPAAIQLCAEMLCIVLVAEGDTGPAKKREHLDRILDQVADRPAIPSEIEARSKPTAWRISDRRRRIATPTCGS